MPWDRQDVVAEPRIYLTNSWWTWPIPTVGFPAKRRKRQGRGKAEAPCPVFGQSCDLELSQTMALDRGSAERIFLPPSGLLWLVPVFDSASARH